MLRVVPPERLCWSKDSKATNRTSDKENGLFFSVYRGRYKQLSCLKACNNGKSVRYLLLLTAGMKRSNRSAPLASGRMSGRPLAGPPSDQSSVDNLRGNRAPKAQSACPLKATQAVQSQSERKDAAATDTPNPKHSEGALQKCVCVCVCVCVRACVCVQH